MATVPLSGTNIMLLNGIPFSSDYKHTRWFDTLTDQTNWFLSRNVVYNLSQYVFQRIEGHTFIDVNQPIDNLWNVNYLMFQNASYNSKWFYAFVTKVEYIQRNNTRIYFQIDVLQTWMFDINFKPSYVLREHCSLWQDTANTIPVVNTVDEGLYYGSEYDVASVTQYKPYDTVYWLVMVSKSTMHSGTNADGSTFAENKINPVLNGLPQPLNYYVHPFKLDGSSPNTNIVTPSSVLEVLRVLSESDSTSGNLVSLYVTEFFGYNYTYDSTANNITLDSTTFQSAMVSDNSTGNFQTLYVTTMPQYNSVGKDLGSKYNDYTSVTESKLLMYPYTKLELTDFKGNSVTFKNEYIRDTDLTITCVGGLGITNKVAYMLEDYDQYNTATDAFYQGMSNALITNGGNDLPIITDYLSAYLQGNQNSIANQKSAIQFNGVMNAIGSALGGAKQGFQPIPTTSQGISMDGMASTGIGMAQSGVSVIQGLGNTQLALNAINAKIADVADQPPSLLKQGGNAQWDYGNGISGCYIVKKEIKSEYRKKLADYFNMFGYKLNEVKTPNFHTRQSFNYVHTQACVITGNLNNQDLNEIKNIFDGGITLWHVDDVGNYTLTNGVI